MQLDFICIGVMKSGTTYLDSLLRNNPHFCLPTKRKETHYFNNNFEKGENWYSSFFENSIASVKKQHMGEVATQYLWHEDAPHRISSFFDVTPKFIVMMRHPVERAYSHWKHEVINHYEKRDFLTTLKNHKNMFDLGLYGKQINRYLNLFDKDLFMFVLFEDLTNDTDETLKKICDHLAVPYDFNLTSSINKNRSEIPNARFTYNLLQKASRFCRRHDLDFLPNIASRMRIGKIFKSKRRSFASISDKDYSYVYNLYYRDMKLLQKTIGNNIDHWFKPL